jgi:hypothetical protein
MGFKSGYSNRFAFLIKSIEVMIAAGVYLIFGMIFGGITIGMFSALSLDLPETIMRLIALGGFGLIPILAITTMYDPLAKPEEQDFSQGLSKFVFTMVRLLLPLALIVLVIYIFVIPFNFSAPYQNRDLLIIYNVMQFAIIGLLIGATPKVDLRPSSNYGAERHHAVTILALILSRTPYRRLSIARQRESPTTIIGWNLINIIILGALAVNGEKAPSWHSGCRFVQ